MSEVNIYEVMQKKAREDAKKVISGGHTVYLFCLRALIQLKRLNKDANLNYYNKGRSCYTTYVDTLKTEVDKAYNEQGLRATHDIPSWNDDRLVAHYG